jgi:hypothetical protein
MRSSGLIRALRSDSGRPRSCATFFSRVAALALGLALGLAPAALRAAPAPQWDGEAEETSTNGAMLIEWKGEDEGGKLEFELQEADRADFEDAQTHYRGTFPSWYVSGRRDGTHYFRVRSRPWSRAEGSSGEWSEWSATKTVVVEHHDLGLALGLMSVGALVFLITVLTLVLGARRQTEASPNPSEASP